MENPSDLITRKQIIDLNSSKLWWEGPIFLKEHDIFENKVVTEIDIIEEKRQNTFVCLSDTKDQVDLNKVLNINKYNLRTLLFVYLILKIKLIWIKYLILINTVVILKNW